MAHKIAIRKLCLSENEQYYKGRPNGFHRKWKVSSWDPGKSQLFGPIENIRLDNHPKMDEKYIPSKFYLTLPISHFLNQLENSDLLAYTYLNSVMLHIAKIKIKMERVVDEGAYKDEHV